MRGMNSLIAVAATAAVAALSAAGCGDVSSADPRPSASLANCVKSGPVEFVVSGRQNSPAAALAGPMGCAAWYVIRDGAHIGIVDLDGQPHPVLSAQFQDPGVNDATLHSDEQNYFGELTAAVRRTRAKYPHANVLDALDVAARAIHAAGAGGTIYLEDSGLQETSPVNFAQPGMLAARPAEVVTFLAREHELPDLRGIKVFFIGLGDVAPPQAPLSIAQRRNLTAIWLAIAKAGGAISRIDPTPRTGTMALHGVPEVLRVPVPPEPPWQPGAAWYPFPDSGPVGFQPNLAVFRDRPAAIAALTPIARYLTAHPSAEIELIGTTAHWGSLAGALQLSRNRANAVEATLISLGARAGQIRTRGLAWRFPGYVNDAGPGGALLPGPAEHNRSVIVNILTG